jgi:hypothetical protein
MGGEGNKGINGGERTVLKMNKMEERMVKYLKIWRTVNGKAIRQRREKETKRGKGKEEIRVSPSPLVGHALILV